MKNKVLLLASLAIFQGATKLKAQLNVGSNTAPNASAVLQATSTTKGFLPPVMTTTQRNTIASLTVGLIIFNSYNDQIEVNTGSPNTALLTAGGAASFYTANGTLSSNRTVTKGSNTFGFVGNNVGVETSAPSYTLDVLSTSAIPFALRALKLLIQWGSPFSLLRKPAMRHTDYGVPAWATMPYRVSA